MSASGTTVLIDGRPLIGDRTGIGVHTAEIAGRLQLGPPPIIASHAPIADRSGIERCRFDVRSAPFGVWWQQIHMARAARELEVDVVWGPHGTLPLRLDVPAVVSMHDLTSITMPHRHRIKTVLSFNLFIRASLERARWIAAVSRCTADEVMHGFAVSPSRIAIVPNGVDPFYSPGAAQRGAPEVEGQYVLYVGTLEPRKGIRELVEAWQSMGARRPRLVLCGASGWQLDPLRRRIEPYVRNGEIIVPGFVDRETLRGLYRGATLFVYPSHHEGFGLPPLEAMACGAPVIAAAGGAIPEVLGDAALLFPPGDAEALAVAMRRMLSDEALRSEHRHRGIARASQYSWERSAALMCDLLVEAAGH